MRSAAHSGFAIVALLCALGGAMPAHAQGRCTQPVARVVSAEGSISVVSVSIAGTQLIPISAGTQLDVCAGERVAAAARSRAQVVLFSSNQTIRINQNTTIRIIDAPQEGPRSVIELLQGIIRLFNPIGRPLDVRTPFVTAGTEGTEFFVAYDPQTEETRAGVIEGVVRVTRASDSLLLSAGQAATAPRIGPLQRLDIVPADAVRWSIFYPPASWALSPTDEAALDGRVARAWQAWQRGDLQTLTMELNAVPQILPPPSSPPFDARSLLRFASLLLIVGQVEEAEAAIAQAELLYGRAALAPLVRPIAAAMGPVNCRSLGADWPLIPALRSIIAVARNQTSDALALSDCAIAAAREAGDPSATISSAIARSYALQSAFRLTEARAILATVESANDPLVFARLAELDLSLGDNRAARREAQRANALAPSLSLTSSILGFAALANYDFAAAESAFARAATQDPGDPLPHLGLGLAAIRSGNFFSFGSRNLEAGRIELVIAVGLNPENAIARSYAGRTYAELRLYQDAFREWALAESADPNDPTAPLYRAFAERALNRPIEALRDIERSIALNDNRAVYRSRLLLDQDLATRTTDLASVYRDLGFDQLALSEGYRSVGADPANPGAHRFLSDTYLALPRHETASDSELLQSLLLQSLNVQPVRPRLAREGLGILGLHDPSRIGFNEFSPVFASNGISVLADAFGGSLGTYGDNLVLSGIHQKFSFSAGQFYYRTDGIRDNNELRRNVENALVQVAVSDRFSVLAEYRHSALVSGDTHLFFDPRSFTLTGMQTQDRSQYRLGGRLDLGPSLRLVGVWTREDRTEAVDNGLGLLADSTIDGSFSEAAFYLSRQQFNVVVGGGYFEGNENTGITLTDLGFSLPPFDAEITHTNAWAYVTANPIENVRLTLGASFDSYSSDIERDQFNPKVGFTWDIVPGSVLRIAYFENLKRTFIGGQTIEPTQIAGFNQLFDDINATRAKRWGVGFDQKVGGRLFTGFEWAKRELGVPALSAGPPITQIEEDWTEEVSRAYLDWIASARISISVGVQWERLARPTAFSSDQNFSDLDLLRVPLEIRFSDPSGMLALLRASLVRETGHFLETNTFTVFGGDDTFVVVDAGIGWRIPGRSVVGTLEVKNLLNAGFRFQDTDPTNPTIIPRRLVIGRITSSF